jgi:hypothetical protein
LLAPVIALVYLGLARSYRVGRVLAGIMVALWAWILVATWTLKLFPMYSGGGSAAMRARDLWKWHVDAHALSQTALAPASWLYAGLVLSVALTVGVGALVIMSIFRYGALANTPASYPPRSAAVRRSRIV